MSELTIITILSTVVALFIISRIIRAADRKGKPVERKGKRCPECGTIVDSTRKKCRHCGHVF